MRVQAGLQVLLALLLTDAMASTSDAQGTARSLDIDTSIRAAGMGGAGAAVWWGEPGVWGNPATLAEVRGVGWVDGRTRLLPGLASNVWFKSSRLLIGGAGVGVSLMGAPIEGLGRLRLDYGASVTTDPFGNPTGTFDAYEQTDAWGVGVAPLQLVQAMRAARNDPGPPREPWPVDVAVGVQRKHARVALDPSVIGGTAEADCTDWGVSGRWSVLGATPDSPAHLEVSGGFAMLNANDASFVFISENQAAPPSRIRREGVALHASLPSPWSDLVGAPPVWLLRGQPHAMELGLASDSEHISAGGHPPGYDVQHFGLEATVLGVLTGRVGHVTDRTGEIVGNTWGFGVRLPIGPYASFTYDQASIPQARDSGLPNVKRQGWSVWLNPWRMWTDLRAER